MKLVVGAPIETVGVKAQSNLPQAMKAPSLKDPQDVPRKVRMLGKHMFLEEWEREFQNTLQFLRAYPSDRLDVKLDTDSPSARDLAWRFVQNEWLIQATVDEHPVVQDLRQPLAPLQEIVTTYGLAHQSTMDKNRTSP